MRYTIVKLGLAFLIVAVAGMALACNEEEDTGQASKAEIVINLTAGTDDPHRASLALAMADAALKTDHKVALFLNVDGVELAVRDLPEDVQYWEFPPIREMMAGIIESGAVVLACPICINEAGIPSGQLLEDVTLATPGELFPYFDRGAVVISYGVA